MNLDWSVVWQYRYDLLHGVLLTIALTFVTMLVAVPGGILLAIMRLSKSRVFSGLSLAFVELFRNLPLILVVYWAFYVMPVLFDIQFSAFTTGLIALCLNVSAYNSETFRAGINSIRVGPDQCWSGPWDEPGAGPAEDRAATSLAPCPSSPSEHVGLTVQGHIARIGDRCR